MQTNELSSAVVEAIAEAEDAVRNRPEDYASFQALGFAYFEAGRYADARTALERAIALNPRAAAAYEKIGHIHYRIGSPLEEAIAAYEQAIAIDPHFTNPYFGLAILHLSKTRDLSRSVEALQRGLAANPGDPFLLAQLAVFEARMGRIEQAVAALEQAARERPDDSDAYGWLSYLYLRLKRLEDAETATRREIALDDRAHSPHRVLGFIDHLKGRDAEAIVELERAVELEPHDYEARAGLAKLYRERGQLPEAELQFNSGMDMSREDGEYGLACFYAVYGDASRALDLLEIDGVPRQVSAGWLYIDPELVFIQENARFQALIKA